MKDDILYEPVGEANYQRTVTALEREIARLKAELLPSTPASPIEYDKQHRIWLRQGAISQSATWRVMVA